jgi:AraC family transcriptional regulator
MNQVADYIEEHLDTDMDYSDLADIVCCTVYQFGRVFSYVVGIPLSEYVRRRRLSQAALELQGGRRKVIDVAFKYGYSSPDAFTRAFVAMHGVTPKEACTLGVKLKLYPRITFHITIKGDTDMEYRIEQKCIVHCAGIEKNFGKVTINKDAQHWTEERPEIWQFWDHFLDIGENIVIRDKYKLYRPPFWQVGFTETLENGDTVVRIGAEIKPDETYPELTLFDIPAHTWAVFTAKGTLNQKVHPITQTMTRVLTEWLPNSTYELIKGIDLETYGPGDTQSDDYICELWLPVKKKG